MNDEDDLKTYKKKNVRELDQIFHANGWISAGGVAATSKAYDRGYIYSFEWCSDDPAKARPDLVKLVTDLMENVTDPLTFDAAFDHAVKLDSELTQMARLDEKGRRGCCGCSCGRCRHQNGADKHTPECLELVTEP